MKSGPLSPESAWELERRVERALAKHDHGEALTGKEEEIVYWVRHGGQCASCAARVPVAVRFGILDGVPDRTSKDGECDGESKPKTEVVGVRRRERGWSVVL